MNQSIGDLIRDARSRMGMNQSELADAVGASQSYISGIERGTRIWPQEYIRQIAEVLGLDQVELAVAAGLIDAPVVQRGYPSGVEDIVAALGTMSDVEIQHIRSLIRLLGERG